MQFEHDLRGGGDMTSSTTIMWEQNIGGFSWTRNFEWTRDFYLQDKRFTTKTGKQQRRQWLLWVGARGSWLPQILETARDMLEVCEKDVFR